MSGFDYSSLNGSGVWFRETADLIRQVSRSMASKAVFIGKKLIEAKERCPHGTFGEWIEHEFNWSYRTAARYMQVAQRFGKCDIVADLSLTVLQILAGDDVPDEAVDEVVSVADSGVKVTVPLAKSIVKKHAKPKNRIAKAIEQTYGEPEHVNAEPLPKPVIAPFSSVVPQSIVESEPIEPVELEPIEPIESPTLVEPEHLTDKQKLAKIMELVASLESPDTQYEVVIQTVALLHKEDRSQLFCKLNAEFKQAEEKQTELFAGDPADLIPPKKINTPEVRKAWGRWCDSNKAKGRPLTVDEGTAQLRLLASGKPDTAVRRIEHALAMRMESLPLAKELPNDFEPPTEEQVMGYAKAMKIPEDMASEFFSAYARQGWKLGNGQYMDDWKQSLHHWQKKQPVKLTPDKDPKYANGAYDPRIKSGFCNLDNVFTG
jgi:hypothetical protein